MAPKKTVLERAQLAVAAEAFKRELEDGIHPEVQCAHEDLATEVVDEVEERLALPNGTLRMLLKEIVLEVLQQHAEIEEKLAAEKPKKRSKP